MKVCSVPSDAPRKSDFITVAGNAVLCNVAVVCSDTAYMSMCETGIRLKALDTGLRLFFLN